jgi:hypothetical protein
VSTSCWWRLTPTARLLSPNPDPGGRLDVPVHYEAGVPPPELSAGPGKAASGGCSVLILDTAGRSQRTGLMDSWALSSAGLSR